MTALPAPLREPRGGPTLREPQGGPIQGGDPYLDETVIMDIEMNFGMLMHLCGRPPCPPDPAVVILTVSLNAHSLSIVKRIYVKRLLTRAGIPRIFLVKWVKKWDYPSKGRAPTLMYYSLLCRKTTLCKAAPPPGMVSYAMAPWNVADDFSPTSVVQKRASEAPMAASSSPEICVAVCGHRRSEQSAPPKPAEQRHSSSAVSNAPLFL